MRGRFEKQIPKAEVNMTHTKERAVDTKRRTWKGGQIQMSAESGKRERNMGVELLRIVSMLLIVTAHILGQGGVLKGVSAAPGSGQYAAAWLLESCALLSVNCYALISGYVAGGQFRYARLFETQMRVWFYTILITAGFCIAVSGLFQPALVKNALFPAMTGQYWYYTAYFGLMLFTPALRCMTEHLGRIPFRNLVVSIVVLFSVCPMLFVSDIYQTAQGYSLVWLTALYLIGAYLKKYGCPFLKKPLYAAASLVLGIGAAWGIQLAGARGAKMPLPNMLVFTSPAMLLAAAAALVLFSKLRLSTMIKKAVGFCAPLSFGVYLIHVHPLVFDRILKDRFVSFADAPAYLLVLEILGAAIAIYIVCTLIEALRAWLFRICRVREGVGRLEKYIKHLSGSGD